MKSRPLAILVLLATSVAFPWSGLGADVRPAGLSSGILAAVSYLAELGERLDLPPFNIQGSLVGRVHDADGRPIGGAKVTVEGLETCPLRTDEYGSFEVELPPDRDFNVSVQALGYLDLTRRVKVIALIKTPVEFALTTRPSFLDTVIQHQDLTKLEPVFAEAMLTLDGRPKGREYIARFDKHSDQLIHIYINHPHLWGPTRILLERLSPISQKLADSSERMDDRSPLLTTSTLDLMLEVLDSYAAFADPLLAADLEALASDLIAMQGLSVSQVLELLGPEIPRAVQASPPPEG